jgi:DNA-3-methyladenine glycosylase
VSGLDRAFFERYSPTVARELLGFALVRKLEGERLSGTIVETEAYRGRRDPASHAYRGMTKRNEVMFGPAGHAYVYFTMGIHHCLNVTTEPAGTPAAVLIRALEPVEGIELMQRNRGVKDIHRLAMGPGNLTKALGIGSEMNGEDLIFSRTLFLEKGKPISEVGISSRVGISRGVSSKWRFFVRGNPSVSKGKPSVIPQNP